jgi:hypothetical protein
MGQMSAQGRDRDGPRAPHYLGGRERLRARLAGSPAEFGKLIADKTEKWAGVIRTAGLRSE